MHCIIEILQIMVFVNLSKLLQLVAAVLCCPNEVPKRLELLIEMYLGFKPSSEHNVSIAVNPKYERIKEAYLDEVKIEIRKHILRDIITQYSENKLTIPVNAEKVYLVSPLKNCDFCSGNLVVVQSRKGEKKAILYTTTGGVRAVLYVKHCTKCCACAYPAYSETVNEAIVRRKYIKSDLITYFSITSETFFDLPLLNMLTEDLFTCFSRFSSFVEKYNRLYEAFPLIKKRIIDAYLINSINTRLDRVEFPVVRDRLRNLNIEETCKALYPLES